MFVFVTSYVFVSNKAMKAEKTPTPQDHVQPHRAAVTLALLALIVQVLPNQARSDYYAIFSHDVIILKAPLLILVILYVACNSPRLSVYHGYLLCS